VRLALLGLERELGGMGLMAPSSTYHHFAVGLDGDKMSSSRPDTTIFLGDEPAKVAKKIKRAFSGGQPTVEEHRRLGGDPDRDVAFQYMAYFFEEDDVVLADLAESYRAGRLLAGEMKQACLERAEVWLGDLPNGGTKRLIWWRPSSRLMHAEPQDENTGGSGPIGNSSASSAVNSRCDASSSRISDRPLGSRSSRVNGHIEHSGHGHREPHPQHVQRSPLLGRITVGGHVAVDDVEDVQKPLEDPLHVRHITRG